MTNRFLGMIINCTEPVAQVPILKYGMLLWWGTGRRKQGVSHGGMGTKQRIGNENTDRAAVPASFPGFCPTSPYGLSTGRRENLGTRLLGCWLPFFIFPFPALATCLKNPTSIIFFFGKRANGSRQLFLRYSTCFHLFFGTTKIRNAWNYIWWMRFMQWSIRGKSDYWRVCDWRRCKIIKRRITWNCTLRLQFILCRSYCSRRWRTSGDTW